MATDAQIKANQANAQKSTGPNTHPGKAKSSLNAVKTGLTGRTVLLPTDDVAAYQQHLDRMFKKFEPANDEEKDLTQSLADTKWRLDRIPALEMGIYAKGRLQFEDQFDNQLENNDPEVRKALIQTETFLAYQRQINNLSTQEARLRRQYEKDEADLRKLQADRKEQRQRQMSKATTLLRDAQSSGHVFDPAEFGFDFTKEEVEAVLEGLRTRGRIERGEYYAGKPKKVA